MIVLNRPASAHYGPDDWVKRDDFGDIRTAMGYAQELSRQYPSTPYRIMVTPSRYSVEYVPEWRLR